MIKESHALSSLKTKDGFRLTGEDPFGDFDIKLDESLLVDVNAGISVPGLKPLRDVIPFTNGRATDWKIGEHIRLAKARKWPTHKQFEFHGETICICGGGPSLAYTLDELRYLQKRGAKVMAINRTQDYLMGLPKTHKFPRIKPWAGIVLESIPHAANYMSVVPGVRYYIASQCHEDTFDKFENSEHYIWHAQAQKAVEAELTVEEKKHMVPAVGSTCGLRAIVYAYMMGFSNIHLFGFDSSYNSFDMINGIRGLNGHPKLHSYRKAETIHDIKELLVKGWNNGEDRHYWGNGNMLAQADEFQRLIGWRHSALTQGRMDNHKLIVHGFGLIPDMAREFGLHYETTERKAA